MSDSKNCEIIAERFSSTFNLSANNDYIKKFFEPKSAELREKLIRYYPEQIGDFDKVCEVYKNALTKTFSNEAAAKAENDDKKKQIMM